jgi:hypothetical protein
VHHLPQALPVARTEHPPPQVQVRLQLRVRAAAPTQIFCERN